MNTTCYTEPAVMRQLSSQESISDSLETKFCLEKVPTSRRSPSKLTSMQVGVTVASARKSSVLVPFDSVVRLENRCYYDYVLALYECPASELIRIRVESN